MAVLQLFCELLLPEFLQKSTQHPCVVPIKLSPQSLRYIYNKVSIVVSLSRGRLEGSLFNSYYTEVYNSFPRIAPLYL